MPNPRDTGKIDPWTGESVDPQVRIDFAWGNIPIQPNDDRDEGAELVYELDSHNIVYEGWGNYPNAPLGGSLVAVPQVPMPCTVQQYITLLEAAGLVFNDSFYEVNTIGPELNGQVTTTYPAAGTLVEPGAYVEVNYYADYVDNNTVPDIAGLAGIAANAAIEAAGFTVGNTSGQTISGATSENTNYVATQNPAAGSQAPAGDAINYVTYAPLSTATTGPIAAIRRETVPGNTWGGLNGDEAIMYLVGREDWPTVGSAITIAETTNVSHNVAATVIGVMYDDSYNTGGTAVQIQREAGFGAETSTGGTWTKN